MMRVNTEILPCVPMDLTLKSAADFMEDHKHFLDGCRGIFTQNPGSVVPGHKTAGKKKSSEGFKFFFLVRLN